MTRRQRFWRYITRPEISWMEFVGISLAFSVIRSFWG